MPIGETSSVSSKQRRTNKQRQYLLWGLRIVVPETLKLTMLNFIHDTHIKVVRIKGMARARVW